MDAQQARRVLDRIVGYKISPFFGKRLKKGLAQVVSNPLPHALLWTESVKLKLLCLRSIGAFAAFVSQKESKDVVKAQFYGDEEKKIELKDEQQVKEILQCLQGAKYQVKSVKKARKQGTLLLLSLHQHCSRRRPES